MRKKTIIGNWKLNGNKDLLNFTLKKLDLFLNQKDRFKNNQFAIIIAPPIVYLENAIKKINFKKLIFLGAQNVDEHLSGPFTGEISVLMLKEIGIKYVILGHSERRNIHKETNDSITNKFKLVKFSNLIPVLCIGETKREKQLGETEKVLQNQMEKIFEVCGNSAFENSIIAYEPIWAIGTGKCAIPSEIQKIHSFIRNYIRDKSCSKIANELIIQYGGSVDEYNVKNILDQKDIDGVLVGAASLDCNKFIKIIEKIL